MSTKKFLYDELDTLSKWAGIPQSVPDSVAQNLNPKYELRPYQVDAFARFFHCHKKDFPDKIYPLHFLFNMATGSGKTLIMAGLILYLYEQGYCNFLFFVNSTNIIEKTKDNFLNPGSIKDRNNRVRAIFAVQKLNEGWDVLNLFDIVRCYEARDTGRAKIGTTTMSEAQLIGRGARYFPFILPQSDERFRRKFDGDLEHELRVLEELHYHSINDSRYIAEIRQALIEQGMMDEREVTRELKLKEPFKKTNFYKFGVVWLNDRQPKDYQRIHSFADLGVKKRNYVHFIATGHGGATLALENGKKTELQA
jgi:hypothetical protein